MLGTPPAPVGHPTLPMATSIFRRPWWTMLLSQVAGYAKELEGWAVGVMDLVEEQEVAHLILSHQCVQ